MKPTIHTSGIIPYKGKQFLIQIRSTNSKNGEEYAFWGGRLEKGETPLKAARREAFEELKLRFKKYKSLGTTLKEQEKQVIVEHTFMLPIDDLNSLSFYEGKGIKKVTIPKARKLRMNPGDNKILDKIEKFLKQ